MPADPSTNTAPESNASVPPCLRRLRAGQPPPCSFPDEPFTRSITTREAAQAARQQRDAEFAGHALPTPTATAAPVMPRRRAPIGRAIGLALAVIALALVAFIGLGLPLVSILAGGQP